MFKKDQAEIPKANTDVKVGEREDVRQAALLVEERQVALFLRFEIVKGDPGEVRDDNVARKSGNGEK